MPNGGRGLMLIDLDAKDTLAGAAAYTRSVKIEGIGRGGKAREETLEIRSLTRLLTEHRMASRLNCGHRISRRADPSLWHKGTRQQQQKSRQNG